MPAIAPLQLSVATYNIHKGFPATPLFARRPALHALREQLQALNTGYCVPAGGCRRTHRVCRPSSPTGPHRSQYEYLADTAVAKPCLRQKCHLRCRSPRQCALLSRYPITRWDNEDVSTHRFERRRGLLHCEIDIPGMEAEALHCVCVHLALTARGRGRQLELLRQRIERLVPANAPLIVAGDFNDWYWRHRATTRTGASAQYARSVRTARAGSPARSFPASVAAAAAGPDLCAWFQCARSARTSWPAVGPCFRSRPSDGTIGTAAALISSGSS